MNYLNFCFGLLEWEYYFLIKWPLFNFIISNFKLLHIVHSEYPFPIFLPLILCLLLLSHKLHSIVGSPDFHQQCTVRPNTILQFVICSIPTITELYSPTLLRVHVWYMLSTVYWYLLCMELLKQSAISRTSGSQYCSTTEAKHGAILTSYFLKYKRHQMYIWLFVHMQFTGLWDSTSVQELIWQWQNVAIRQILHFRKVCRLVNTS